MILYRSIGLIEMNETLRAPTQNEITTARFDIARHNVVVAR